MKRVSVSGHFGELLQGRLGESGPVVLVTLPAPHVVLDLVWRAGPFVLHQPRSLVWTRAALANFLQRCGMPVSGHFTFSGHVPVGCGAGSSTLARLAVLRALRPQMPVHRMERLIWRDEGASDPLARRHPERWLWASRAGRALAPMPAMPRLRVVGGICGAPVRTDPRDMRFPDISDLVAAWPHACRSAKEVAALATQSAVRTAVLRGRDISTLQSVGQATGALGMAIAHTGSLQALLLHPAADPGPALAGLQAAGFTYLSSFIIGDGHAGSHPQDWHSRPWR